MEQHVLRWWARGCHVRQKTKVLLTVVGSGSAAAKWPLAVRLDSICAKVNSAPYILGVSTFKRPTNHNEHNIRYSVQVRIGQRMVEIHERQARGGQRAALRSPLQLATHRPMRRRAQSPPPQPWAPPRRLPPCAHRCARRASTVSSSSRGSWRSRCTCRLAR